MKKILIVLLALGLVKSVLLALIIPPWKAEDELHHWGYANALWQNKAILLNENQAYLSQGALDFYLKTENKILKGQEIQKVDQEMSAKRREISRLHLTTNYQPPLYYLPIAWIWRIFPNENILGDLYLGRMTSSLWYTATLGGLLVLTGQLGIRWRYRILTLVVAMGWPQLSFLGAILNPQIAEICLFTWGMVAILYCDGKKLSWASVLIMSLLMAMLMLVKHTAIVYGAMIGCLFIYEKVKTQITWPDFMSKGLIVSLVCLLPMYAYYLISRSTVYINENRELNQVNLINYLINQWAYQKKWIVEGFWEVRLSSIFGADGGFAVLGKLLMAGTVVGMGMKLKSRNIKGKFELPLILATAGSLGLVEMLIYWGYMRFNLSGEQWIKGRYFISMLPGYLVFARVGLSGWRQKFKKLVNIVDYGLAIWSFSYLTISYVTLIISFYLLNQV